MERSNGLIPVLPWDMHEIRSMVASAREFINGSEIAGVFDSGKPEQSVIWDENGVLCKARPDWLNEEICLHVKTTKRSVNPDTFERLIVNMGYDISLGFYALGIEGPRQVILAIEQDPPYACKLYGLSRAQMDITLSRVHRAINAWRGCAKAGTWPAYTGEIYYIEPSSWQMERALQDGDIDGLGYEPDIANEQGVQA